MIELKGKYNKDCKIFIDDIEQEAIGLIQAILDQPVSDGVPVRIMPDTHAGKDIVIGFCMPLTDKYLNPNHIGVDIGCFDKDTEYLSPNGWVKISEYNGGDVMQFNLDTNIGEFVKPLAYIKKECDEFYHIKTKYGIDQMLSPEHRCLVYKYDRSYLFNKYEIVLAEDLYNKHCNLKRGYRHRFLTSFNLDKKYGGIALSDEMLRVFVMVCADGHYSGNYCYLRFKKERKKERAINLLNDANIKFEYEEKDDVFCFKFNKISDNRILNLWESNNHQLNIISDEVFNWDGNYQEKCYYTRKKEEADFINYAFSAIGYRSVLRKDVNNNDGVLDYRVYKHDNIKIGINGTPKTDINIVKSVDGFKYCFTVPSQYLVMRRNGNIFITGNCGMKSGKLSANSLDLEKIDKRIRELVPMGFDIHEDVYKGELPFADVQKTADLFTQKFNEKFGTTYTSPTYDEKWLSQKLKDIKMDESKFYKSIGTLGSGNHFIEVGEDENGDYWATVHTGSRNFGLKVAEYWVNVAKGKVIKTSKEYDDEFKYITENTIPKSDIPKKIKELKEKHGLGVNKDYLQNENMFGYLMDMVFAQKYAELNRSVILNNVGRAIGGLKQFDDTIECVHNFINFSDMVIRKGAISAYENEKVIIPFSMKDGLIIARGKSNEDWLCSAPHGAGRLMSRSKAKETIDLKDFKAVMKGIYSTSVNKSTIDESPFAYKNADMIKELIEPTVEILHTVKPVLNIKDSSSGQSWKKKKAEKKKRDLERKNQRKMKRGN
jgi:RNA-splicing ligase RtcB